MAQLTVESLWLSGRASERGIRRSEVRFPALGLRIFSLSHARGEKYLALLLFNTHNMDGHRSRSITLKNGAGLNTRTNQMVEDSILPFSFIFYRNCPNNCYNS